MKPWKITVIIVLGIAAVQMLMVSRQPSTKVKVTKTAPEDRITILSEDLGRTYEDNEINGDLMYKGKLLRVNGIVLAVASLPKNKSYVLLQGGSNTKAVACYFDEGQEVGLAGLHSGKGAVIEGRCRGMKNSLVVVTESQLMDAQR